jgi:hypothetical protein
VLRLSAPITLNGNQEWSGVLIADQLDIAGGPGDLLIFNTTVVNLASSQNSFAGRVKFTGTANGTVGLDAAGRWRRPAASN